MSDFSNGKIIILKLTDTKLCALVYNWSVEMEKVGHKMENSSDFIKNFPF